MEYVQLYFSVVFVCTHTHEKVLDYKSELMCSFHRVPLPYFPRIETENYPLDQQNAVQANFALHEGIESSSNG